ncbi:MAG: InlB B-repeat-containing protein, partial [Anaerorhabdus sp.]
SASITMGEYVTLVSGAYSGEDFKIEGFKDGVASSDVATGVTVESTTTRTTDEGITINNVNLGEGETLQVTYRAKLDIAAAGFVSEELYPVNSGATFIATPTSEIRNLPIPKVSGLAEYTITSSIGAGGSISPVGAITVVEGSDQTYIITPDAGYEIEDVLVDGVSVGAITSYTFSNVVQDHTIEVVFKTIPVVEYTIDASAQTGGSISPSGAVTVAEGANQSFTMTPDAGYQVKDILVDGVSVGVADSYNFSNVTENHTIEVQFEEARYSLKISSNSLGTVTEVTRRVPFGISTRAIPTDVTVDVEVTLSQGETLDLSVTPTDGNKVIEVYINGVLNKDLVDVLNGSTSYTVANLAQDIEAVVVFGVEGDNNATYHTVNFLDCEGNIVGQAWPQPGENVTGPSGYTYGADELVNITFSKDVKPTNCSGGFTIPNTGRR